MAEGPRGIPGFDMEHTQEHIPQTPEEYFDTLSETHPHALARITLNAIKHMINGVSPNRTKEWMQKKIVEIDPNLPDEKPPITPPSLDLSSDDALQQFVQDGRNMLAHGTRLSAETLQAYPELSSLFTQRPKESTREREALFERYRHTYDAITDIMMFDSTVRIETLEQAYPKINNEWNALTPKNTFEELSPEARQQALENAETLLQNLKTIFNIPA